MNAALTVLLAALSIWDYPARFPAHEQLRRQFGAALGAGDSKAMEAACRKGVELLPDDPTWHYNLACSLAAFPKREEEAFDELEKAIDCGFRDADAIAKDGDLRRLSKFSRYAQLVEYAREMKARPLLLGPMATVAATGTFGSPLALGEQNLGWDFESGCFLAQMTLAAAPGATATGNTGDLYMNRDGGHSVLQAAAFPGLTVVSFDADGRSRGADLNAPNVLFPYPVFGNSSRAFVGGENWRSIPRMLLTVDAAHLARYMKLYLSNQTWVFPSNADTPPVGSHGDVFSSIAPYWMTTAGRSYSDLPCLGAALAASGAFRPEVKRELVRRGLLAPTIQTLVRKTLASVTNETDYLTARAHPTALPGREISASRAAAAAKALTAGAIPPLAVVSIAVTAPKAKPVWPELTYATPFAWAFVLRADDDERVFTLAAKGAKEFAFVQTHGSEGTAKVERLGPAAARVTVWRSRLSPTNRVDVTVVGRNDGTGWGAPTYVSFARTDPAAPYSDPVLTPRPMSVPPAPPSTPRR